MTDSLGFVVLARRPGIAPQPVSAVFPELEQAQNAIEYCAGKLREVDLDPVEYVIGEIRPVQPMGEIRTDSAVTAIRLYENHGRDLT